MDNPDTGNANNNLDKPIPLDGGSPAPAKGDAANGPAVSRAPLNLGGPGAGGATPSPAPPNSNPSTIMRKICRLASVFSVGLT